MAVSSLPPMGAVRAAIPWESPEIDLLIKAPTVSASTPALATGWMPVVKAGVP
jgi:hypothetical protein